jgi:hypothetical protein
MRSVLYLAAVVGIAAPALAAPIELVDPQDPANYVPVTLVATPLDAVRIATPLPPLDTYEALIPATPAATTFWLNRSNLRIQPQLRGWLFDRTTWHPAGGFLLDLRQESQSQSITLTPSTEPYNGDMEIGNGIIDRPWIIDGGTTRTVLMRAFITPEPSALSLAMCAAIGISLHRRRRAHVVV